MSLLTTLTEEARLTLSNLSDAASDLAVPSVRLGVTGLARAGKTVFITALVHNLLHGGRLPVFQAAAGGRLAHARLQPQPDDAVPRFDYEAHVAALVNDRIWPDSTRQVSELRLTLDFESASFLSRQFGRGKLHIDLIDYPGEWLLDLPLLGKTYAEFSASSLARARAKNRTDLAAEYLACLASIDPNAAESEQDAQKLAATFKTYLKNCRQDAHALSMLPPGRFLMPGDLDGSPALTFAPLDIPQDASPARAGTLRAMMERRFEAYKTHVIRPFFRNHFARLDRQIVLVDVLHALNAGPAAIKDLEEALGEVMTAFRPGKQSWLSSILTRRIDRILFAATKADHLHRDDHDRLEAILQRLVGRGIDHAKFRGAEVDVLAMAAVRATREATVRHGGQDLPAILGTPLPGEGVNGENYDGETEIAMFPGDLPENPDKIFSPADSKDEQVHVTSEEIESQTELTDSDLRYLRFRPPQLDQTAEGLSLSLPHIRLDRALEFLIGDHLA
ncbi:amino acid regulated cytosolic protein [Roseibium sp. TrichSKD4]|uniref:YcjX family protein n=1 Tax=Roseibium sp. TrichSKD4 TaxID=744980 RepID=UPI0001E57446|nr:YcjX family protein [Roseibium sp. TrichSKD4]EFO30792.1 amino acid regulated cytosolic protein [Roseibium sp. TrichSKD4]